MESSVLRQPGVGALLREWRTRRRRSQLDLALDAGVSARHLSFVETGRSRPSSQMLLQLAEQLEVPLRERNRLLLAAGYAPVYEQYDLEVGEMAPVRKMLQQILDGHDPYPAVVVDGSWELLASNRGMAILLEGVAPELLEPPVNVYRVALHPDGIAPRLANLGECREHLLARLRRQVTLGGHPSLQTLYDEVSAYPGRNAPERHLAGTEDGSELAVPLRLRTGEGELAFISTIATFGTAVEVTLSELSIESFFPLNERTATAVRGYVQRLPRT
jgi:transcriptional regulator with XRE-family HTH domain